MTRVRWGLWLLGIAGLIAVLAMSVARTGWELGYRDTVIAVNLGDLAHLTEGPEELAAALTEMRQAGATAVTVSPTLVEPLRAQFFPQRLPSASVQQATLDTVRRLDLGIYGRLDAWVPDDQYEAYAEAFQASAPQGLIAARALGLPAEPLARFSEAIDPSNPALLGWAEFARLPAWSTASPATVSDVFRAHLLERAERRKLSHADALNRYGQAVRERRVRLVEVRATRLAQARRDVFDLRERLEQNGYRVSTSPPPVPDFANPASRFGSFLRDGLAWLFAALAPLAAYAAIRFRQSDGAYGATIPCLPLASGISALGGLAAAAVLSDPGHFLGLRDIPGVRPAMVVPIAGASLWTLSHSSLRAWRLPDVLVWTGVGGVVLVALLRSGNASALPVPELEIALRNALESALVVRPRFKEFLVGHPALLVWLSLGSIRWRPWAVGLLAIGMLGQVSIVNSFLHLHTPLWVTLLRTFHGLWLGLGIGLVLVHLRRALARRRP